MRVSIRSSVALLALLLAFSGCSDDGSSSPEETGKDAGGRLVFVRGEPTFAGTSWVYTVDVDGHHLDKLMAEGANGPHWSPDGTTVSVFCCEDGMAAHLVEVADGAVSGLPPASDAVETSCGRWSADGRRLACEGYGVSDTALNGVYSVRVSDGRGLRQLTSNRGGGDLPGDFSPDGGRLAFFRETSDGDAGLFLADLGGGHRVHRLSPRDLQVRLGAGGSWSPVGSEILFVARRATDDLDGIWVADADSGEVHEMQLAGCGGSASAGDSAACSDPAWSPDGTMFVFTRAPNGTPVNEVAVGDLYIADADGAGVRQVTDVGDASQADW